VTYDDKRHLRRINVTFTEQTIKLIEEGVKAGMALNETEYVRMAVEEYNKQIPIYKKIKELIDDNIDLGEILRKLEQLDLQG